MNKNSGVDLLLTNVVGASCVVVYYFPNFGLKFVHGLNKFILASV